MSRYSWFLLLSGAGPLFVIGCIGDIQNCVDECYAEYEDDVDVCYEQYYPDAEDIQECIAAAAEEAAECVDDCYDIYSSTDPSITLVVDTDWPTVHPMWIEEGDAIDLIATDVDASTGWANVVDAMPLEDIWNTTAWDSFRTTYVYNSLQSSRDVAKFYYASMADVVNMSQADLYNITDPTPWTYIDMDTDDSDGLSVSFDTTGLSPGVYVTRVYMFDLPFPNPRFGFGMLLVVDLE